MQEPNAGESAPRAVPNRELLAQWLQEALGAQQSGRPAQAMRIYQMILAADPDSVDALHFMGLLFADGPDRARGIALMRRAIQIKPDFMQAHFNLGNVYRMAGEPGPAIDAYRRALKLQPKDVDILVNLGDSLRAVGQQEEAQHILEYALAEHPEAPLVHYNLALLRLDQQRTQEAEQHLRAALRLAPESLVIVRGLLHVLRLQNLHAEVVQTAIDAIAVAPRDPDLRIACGTSLLAVGQAVAAQEAFASALRLIPDSTAALVGLSRSRSAQGDLEGALRMLQAQSDQATHDAAALELLAIAYYDLHDYPSCARMLVRAQAKDPDDRLRARYAMCLRSMGRIDDALAAIAPALARNPRSPAWLTNHAVLLRARGDHRGAEAALDEALAIDPRYPEARFNRALLRLTAGDLETAWADYELREVLDPENYRGSSGVRASSAPRWDGRQPLFGRTILLRADQGFGDTIHFARYARPVASAGAHVVLQVQHALLPIVASLGYPTIALGEPVPLHDYWCPLASLAGLFETRLDSIPCASGYLRAPAPGVNPGSKAPRLDGRLQVAVAWSGRRNAANNRSIPLADFSNLFKSERIRFLVAQTDVYAQDEHILNTLDLPNVVRPQLRDFGETALLLESADLVITVDSALAHLAGALGRPTWLLLAFAPDWRWHLERTDSPWYESLELFRQEALGDWGGVLARVEKRLAALLEYQP